MPKLSSLARNLTAETAFTVLAIARALKAKGKDVVELEIGDSPFPTTPRAKVAGIRAIEENQTGYCPSLGLPEFRAAAAQFVTSEFGYSAAAENVVVGSGAKPFEQFFAENENVRHETTVEEILAANGWAIERGRYTMTYTPRKTGSPIVETGRHVMCRRKVDNNWQIVWEIWNTDKPLK